MLSCLDSSEQIGPEQTGQWTTLASSDPTVHSMDGSVSEQLIPRQTHGAADKPLRKENILLRYPPWIVGASARALSSKPQLQQGQVPLSALKRSFLPSLQQNLM